MLEIMSTFRFLKSKALQSYLEKFKFMNEKKGNSFESPNINKLQSVAIDKKTTIYIALDADPEEAKRRYLSRINRKAVVLS